MVAPAEAVPANEVPAPAAPPEPELPPNAQPIVDAPAAVAPPPAADAVAAVVDAPVVAAPIVAADDLMASEEEEASSSKHSKSRKKDKGAKKSKPKSPKKSKAPPPPNPVAVAFAAMIAQQEEQIRTMQLQLQLAQLAHMQRELERQLPAGVRASLPGLPAAASQDAAESESSRSSSSSSSGSSSDASSESSESEPSPSRRRDRHRHRDRDRRTPPSKKQHGSSGRTPLPSMSDIAAGLDSAMNVLLAALPDRNFQQKPSRHVRIAEPESDYYDEVDDEQCPDPADAGRWQHADENAADADDDDNVVVAPARYEPPPPPPPVPARAAGAYKSPKAVSKSPVATRRREFPPPSRVQPAGSVSSSWDRLYVHSRAQTPPRVASPPPVQPPVRPSSRVARERTPTHQQPSAPAPVPAAAVPSATRAAFAPKPVDRALLARAAAILLATDQEAAAALEAQADESELDDGPEPEDDDADADAAPARYQPPPKARSVRTGDNRAAMLYPGSAASVASVPAPRLAPAFAPPPNAGGGAADAARVRRPSSLLLSSDDEDDADADRDAHRSEAARPAANHGSRWDVGDDHHDVQKQALANLYAAAKKVQGSQAASQAKPSAPPSFLHFRSDSGKK